MNDPTFLPIIRDTTQNHTEIAPNCDARCDRWGGLAHAHICPDGINNNDTPFLDVTAWCSCGARFGEPVHLDTRDPARTTAQRSNAAGKRFAKAFEVHMAVAHGIDVRTDVAWLARLETPVGAPPPAPKMRRTTTLDDGAGGTRTNAWVPGIECLACGRISWNPTDVAEVYCANCRLYGVLA